MNATPRLPCFLGIDTEMGHGLGTEAPQSDRLPGFLAIAVCAILDARQRRVDPSDKPPATGTIRQGQKAFGFHHALIENVGLADSFLVQGHSGALLGPDELLAPPKEQPLKILDLARIHVGFRVGRNIAVMSVSHNLLLSS
jgi:hypothetical protein